MLQIDLKPGLEKNGKRNAQTISGKNLRPVSAKSRKTTVSR